MNNVTPSQIAKMITLVAQSGIERHQLQNLLENGHFATLLHEYTHQVLTPIRIEKQEGKGYRVQDLSWILEKNYFRKIDPLITPENFPSSTFVSTQKKVQYHIFTFQGERENLTEENIRNLLTARGFRNAELMELIDVAMSIGYPWNGKDSLRAFGSTYTDDEGKIYYPVVTSEKCLGLIHAEPDCPFLDDVQVLAVKDDK